MNNQKKIIDILRNDEMVKAIKKNDVRQIKKLIDSGYDVKSYHQKLWIGKNSLR